MNEINDALNDYDNNINHVILNSKLLIIIIIIIILILIKINLLI